MLKGGNSDGNTISTMDSFATKIKAEDHAQNGFEGCPNCSLCCGKILAESRDQEAAVQQSQRLPPNTNFGTEDDGDQKEKLP